MRVIVIMMVMVMMLMVMMMIIIIITVRRMHIVKLAVVIFLWDSGGKRAICDRETARIEAARNEGASPRKVKITTAILSYTNPVHGRHLDHSQLHPLLTRYPKRCKRIHGFQILFPPK